MPSPVIDPRPTPPQPNHRVSDASATTRAASAWLVRALALTLVLLPAAGLRASAPAPSHSRVESPHGSFKGDCGLCHGAEGWKPARISPRFNHASFGFALTGAHAGTQCTACHGSLDFSSSRKLCVSCHEDPHRGEMGAACARCHSARSFIDRSAMVRAHQGTAFPLTGSHAGLDCETCHRPVAQGQMRFVGTHAVCQSCHLDAYRSAKTPDHVAGGFPLDCANCHSTLTWSTARFDHNQTAFPLTGAHRSVACQSCHGDGVYKGKSTDCYSCHKGNYDATTDPIHTAAGFSTQCATCHNTTSWAGALFNHDAAFFRINAGGHQGRWSACADCHTNSANFAVFTCLSCHPHSDQAVTSGTHSGVSGYRYDSNACYSCHRR